MKLVIDDKGNKQLVRGEKDLHTKAGVVKAQDIKKGGVVESHLGRKFKVLEASIIDYIEHMEKCAQVVYPKDSSLIIGLTGIGPGSRVVEAGTGVGGFTIPLANAVRPNGRVYTYEIREEHQKEAKKHIEAAGLGEFVDFKLKSVYEGIDEREVDAVILDLSEPWEAAKPAAAALKDSGHLVSYSPSIEQVKRFATSLPKDFVDLRTVELILRDWEVSDQRCRPKTRMIGHTGFITFARLLK